MQLVHTVTNTLLNNFVKHVSETTLDSIVAVKKRKKKMQVD